MLILSGSLFSQNYIKYYIQYFYPNGQKQFEYIAIDGNPVGDGYTYFETGELKKVTYFNDVVSEKSITFTLLN